MTTPMTAAEYRMEVGVPRTILGERLLAALEEREALLAEIEALRKRAEIGAMVRRIREHPMCGTTDTCIYYRGVKGYSAYASFSDEGLAIVVAYLDSLLPKEPEVVTKGASGREYRRNPWGVLQYHGERLWEAVDTIPVEDAPVVAKLMEGRDNG